MSEDGLSHMRALLLDDSPHMLSILRTILQGFGVTDVAEARDAATAFEMVRDHRPDFAVIDLQLDDLSGLEFTQLIRTAPDSPDRMLPIIMVTAHSERRRIIDAINAGVNEFLVKPVSPKALFSRIRAVIERPRPFIKAPGYFGPDRRRQNLKHNEERRQDMQEQAPVPAEQAMEQDQINAIFNPGSKHPDDQTDNPVGPET